MKEEVNRRTNWYQYALFLTLMTGLIVAPVDFRTFNLAEAIAKGKNANEGEKNPGGRAGANKDRSNNNRKSGNRSGNNNDNSSRDKKAREDRDKKAREDRDKKAREDRDKKAREDRDKKAREDRDKKAREDRDKKAREDRDRKAREDRDRKAREDRDKKAREDRDRKAREDRDRKAREDRDRKAREDRDRKAREDRDRKAREDRNRAERERKKRERRHVRDDRRRAERDRWRNDGSHYKRRIRRDYRREVRNDHRWERRLRRWVNHPTRPTRPRYGRIIVTPIPFPQVGYWTYKEIVNTADALEYMVQELYRELSVELSSAGHWNDEVLSEMYDYLEATREYGDALETYDYSLRESLYELFNMEEEMLEAQAYLERTQVSPYIWDNFNLAKYYVEELLWTYKQNVRDFDHLRDVIVNPDQPDYGTRYMYIDADSLNFRYAPTTSSSSYVCGQLPRGTIVKVVGTLRPEQNYYSSNITWAEIEVNDNIKRHINNSSCYVGTETVYVALSYLKY